MLGAEHRFGGLERLALAFWLMIEMALARVKQNNGKAFAFSVSRVNPLNELIS